MQTTYPLALKRSPLSFDPRQIPHYRFDVVVLGSGAGGSIAALSAASRGASVALVTKGRMHETNTNFAQGGMAAVVAPVDSLESHTADTLRVGCGLSDRVVVEEVIRGGADAVRRLTDLGAEFDRGDDGGWDLSREGGHSHQRVLHAQGDATGLEIQRTVSSAVEQHARITTFPHTFAIELYRNSAGDVCGMLCLNERGDPVGFRARHVVLATGGAGQLYRETTNPTIATGDGVALGFRSGAVVRDLEFMQFHPTCLYIAGAARVLISEIVRGAGGLLRDRHGERFMPSYHPQAELAPRDVVSRAVFERMVATGDTNVYLDLSQLSRDPHQLFPGISRICRFFGIDIAADPIPVRPGAHYQVGGLLVDQNGRTTVGGLSAVGEVASTGLHGANRMGSNSLLEAVVLGARAGEQAALNLPEHSDPMPLPYTSGHQDLAGYGPGGVQLNIEDLTYSLKSMMWRQMGVERSEAGLVDALEKLSFWTRAVQAFQPQTPRAWELMNMLTVARLATYGALMRVESRGVHYRTDCPNSLPEWKAHTCLKPQLEADSIQNIEMTRVPTNDVVSAS